MPLNTQEIQLLAGLKSDPAFMLLLTKIETLIEDASDVLLNAKTLDDEDRALSMWRALRVVHAELKYTPEAFAIQVEENIQNLGGDLGQIDRMSNLKLREVFKKMEQIQQDTGQSEWVAQLERAQSLSIDSN